MELVRRSTKYTLALVRPYARPQFLIDPYQRGRRLVVGVLDCGFGEEAILRRRTVGQSPRLIHFLGISLAFTPHIMTFVLKFRTVLRQRVHVWGAGTARHEHNADCRRPSKVHASLK